MVGNVEKTKWKIFTNNKKTKSTGGKFLGNSILIITRRVEKQRAKIQQCFAFVYREYSNSRKEKIDRNI